MINEPTTLDPVLATITILGSGRVGPTAAALLGLAGTVVGGLALARSRRRNTDIPAANSRRRVVAALSLGLLSLVLGVVFLAAADAGPGTGNGVVGSAAAIVLGPIAIVLGWLASTMTAATDTRTDAPVTEGAA